MGTVTSKEHEDVLHEFRGQLLSMLDSMLGYTTLQTTDKSVRRVILLHQQVKGLSLSMLQYFATKWVKACEEFIDIIVSNPDEGQIQTYIDKLKHLDIKLPDNGSGKDMHKVVIELTHEQKQEIIRQLQAIHDQASTAKKMGETKPKKAAKPVAPVVV